MATLHACIANMVGQARDIILAFSCPLLSPHHFAIVASEVDFTHPPVCTPYSCRLDSWSSWLLEAVFQGHSETFGGRRGPNTMTVYILASTALQSERIICGPSPKLLLARSKSYTALFDYRDKLYTTQAGRSMLISRFTFPLTLTVFIGSVFAKPMGLSSSAHTPSTLRKDKPAILDAHGDFFSEISGRSAPVFNGALTIRSDFPEPVPRITQNNALITSTKYPSLRPRFLDLVDQRMIIDSIFFSIGSNALRLLALALVGLHDIITSSWSRQPPIKHFDITLGSLRMTFVSPSKAIPWAFVKKVITELQRSIERGLSSFRSVAYEFAAWGTLYFFLGLAGMMLYQSFNAGGLGANVGGGEVINPTFNNVG